MHVGVGHIIVTSYRVFKVLCSFFLNRDFVVFSMCRRAFLQVFSSPSPPPPSPGPYTNSRVNDPLCTRDIWRRLLTHFCRLLKISRLISTFSVLGFFLHNCWWERVKKFLHKLPSDPVPRPLALELTPQLWGKQEHKKNLHLRRLWFEWYFVFRQWSCAGHLKTQQDRGPAERH